MKKSITAVLVSLVIFTLTSCMTYTIKDGLDNIQIQEETTVYETRYNEILRLKAEAQAEAERLEAEKKAEAQRKYDEEQALKQNLDAINTALEKQAELNPYPQALAELKVPHIYRPQNTKAVLNEKLTKLNVLFLPLGNESRSKENIALIAQNVSTIPLEFIFVTGSRENQVSFVQQLNKDAVTLAEGTIIFTLELKEANEQNANFILCGNKTLSTSVIDVTVDGYKETLAMIDAEYSESPNQNSNTFNLGLFAKTAKDNEQANKAQIDSALEGVGETTLFAISQSEPATIDWSIFTPYSYRTDFEWPLSNYIADLGYRDTFEETRYSVEESAGITQEIGENIKERFDFLYSKGLMEVTSSTLALSGLTDAANPAFALLATYIVP